MLPGWGATEFSFGSGEQSEFLVQLDVTVNSSTSYPFMLETNVGPAGADPCLGDSGGPLLLREGNQEWLLVGTLIGGGFDCLNPYDRSDNTSDWNKVSALEPWINTIIEDEAGIFIFILEHGNLTNSTGILNITR